MYENRESENLHNLSLNPETDKKNIYNEWANDYDDYVKKLNYLGPKHFVKYLFNFLNSKNSNKCYKILDFGCGTGLLGNEIDKNSNNKSIFIDGIDISDKMLEKSKDKNIYNNIFNINLFDKRLEINYKYDLILSCGVFLEGHVKFSMINILLDYIDNGSYIIITIRDSFKISNIDEYNKYIDNNNRLIVEDDIYIKYLPNVNCKLILIKKLY